MNVDVCGFKGLGETARGRGVPLRKLYVMCRVEESLHLTAYGFF